MYVSAVYFNNIKINLIKKQQILHIGPLRSPLFWHFLEAQSWEHFFFFNDQDEMRKSAEPVGNPPRAVVEVGYTLFSNQQLQQRQKQNKTKTKKKHKRNATRQHQATKLQ